MQLQQRYQSLTVDPDDVPAGGLIEIGQESTNDGRSEMASVEGLGNIRRGEFDNLENPKSVRKDNAPMQWVTTYNALLALARVLGIPQSVKARLACSLCEN